MYHSLSDRRSFTDPITNWVQIGGLSIERDLGRLNRTGQYPRKCLPDFVHEAVHHMCFDSYVGLALSVLRYRARHNALVQAPLADDVMWDVAECLLRYDTAIDLMRPFAEGMALFGEFDAYPGDGPVLSDVLALTAISFPEILEVETTTSVSAVAQQTLSNARRQTSMRDRKANLLTQPLNVAAGGYLPGYLTVKNLRTLLISRGCTSLLDSDLYLQILKYWFYDDLGLVAELLDPDKVVSLGITSNNCLQAISVRFQKRIQQLLQVSNEEIDRIAQALLEGQHAAKILLLQSDDDGTFLKGLGLLESAVEEVTNPPDNISVSDRKIRQYHANLFNQRHLYCIGSFEAYVRVNENRRAVVFPSAEKAEAHAKDTFSIVASAPALASAELGEGVGSIEVFTSLRNRTSIYTVSRDGKMVAIFSSSDAFDQASKDTMENYVFNLRSAASHTEHFRKAVDKILADESVALVTKHYREENLRVSQELYTNFSLMFTPEELFTALANAMYENGLYSLLQEDFDLVNELAELSLLGSAISNVDFYMSDNSMRKTITRVEELGKLRAFPMVRRVRDTFLMMYV